MTTLPRAIALSRPWAMIAATPPVLAAALAVAALYGVVATGLALWPQDEPQALEAAGPGAGLQLATEAPLRLRCETCGVVAGIRRIEAAEDGTVSYEFAVRMADGSLRHSSDALPGRWQVGDHMQLIGGGRTWSAP
jgi:hypothetical protein